MSLPEHGDIDPVQVQGRVHIHQAVLCRWIVEDHLSSPIRLGDGYLEVGDDVREVAVVPSTDEVRAPDVAVGLGGAGVGGHDRDHARAEDDAGDGVSTWARWRSPAASGT